MLAPNAASRLVRPPVGAAIQVVQIPGYQRTALAVAVLGAVLGFALWLRLPELERPSGNYDEGVYLASLLLMRHGYRPFADIVSTQGVLHLDLAYLPYALGGYTLEAARTGSVLAAIATAGAAAWAAWAIGGRVAGVAAAAAVAVSPTFLWVSRQALPEAPAAAFATLAVAAAAQARRSDRDRWRLAAGVALALACLVKPAVAPAALPVLLLAARGRSIRPAMLVLGAGALASGLCLAALGGPGVLEQVLGWRLSGRQIEISLPLAVHNADLLIDKMYRQEQPAFYLLAAAGGLALAARTPLAGAAAVAWLIAQTAALLAYANLSSHLGALLIPPLGLLAGCAVGSAASWTARRVRPIASLACTAAVVLYLMAVPAVIERDWLLVEGDVGADPGLTRTERALVRTIARLTDPDDWVLTDAPYLAFLANRLVPPTLVDPSAARIASGALDEQQVLRALREYDPEIVLFWTGKLGRFEGVRAAVERQLTLVEEFEPDDSIPRAIYLDPD